MADTEHATIGKWFLVVNDWDSMASSLGEQVETRYELAVATEREAIEVGKAKFSALRRYQTNGRTEWPREPRVILEFQL
jgi:hypothetical protein